MHTWRRRRRRSFNVGRMHVLKTSCLDMRGAGASGLYRINAVREAVGCHLTQGTRGASSGGGGGGG
jgi:hypothetical protein